MNHIDQAIYESEKEMSDGADSINLNEAFERLNKNTMDKYKGRQILSLFNTKGAMYKQKFRLLT